MAKVQVTKELGETIRRIRNDNNIKANGLAAHINKSPAYITKLEKAELKMIDEDNLVKIFSFITKRDRQQTDLELLVDIYSRLRVFYTPKELEEQVWFDNFESVRCKLPVPEDLVDNLNNSIVELNIDRKTLLSRINANEMLSAEVLEKCENTPNQWKLIEAASEGKQIAIKIELPATILDALLDRRIDTCAYIYVFCVAYYLKKIRQYNDQVLISDPEHNKLYDETTDYLNKYHFYTVSKRDALMSAAKSKEEAEQFLTSYDSESQQIIRDIIAGFSFVSDVNIKKANIQLRAFLNNMKWDLGFTMALISLDFSSLEALSYNKKKELLDLIRNKIQELKTLPKGDNIEVY